MAEKGMIVENPLALLPLFEGMQLLADEAFVAAEKPDQESELGVEPEPSVREVAVAAEKPGQELELGLEPEPSVREVAVAAEKPGQEPPATSEKGAVAQEVMESSPDQLPEIWILNVWVDENKKHWPEEYRASLSALLGAIKWKGEPVDMSRIQVLNPLVFTDRHGIKTWALSKKPQSILIWGNQTNLDDVPAVFEATQWEGVPVFRLPAFSSVVANVDNKKLTWKKLKEFFDF